ncbi:hypothetical protein GCM10010280_66390 [Streptomyces pilosus]|uniref:Uncharacterized protein n=1 Tax=Streptomyces pilosus TaxID=28893 RepID=A0A918F4Z9_9ACTN|nr:hypothetical protein GCM10010280_66390 [Streptomyces pilosus]
MSATMNRWRPFTFLTASKPLVAAGTVSTVRTACASIKLGQRLLRIIRKGSGSVVTWWRAQPGPTTD